MAASPASASRKADRLTPAEQALVLDEHAWELYNAHRFGEAVSASERAAHLFERGSGATPRH